MCALVSKTGRTALYSCYICNLRGSGRIMLPADVYGQQSLFWNHLLSDPALFVWNCCTNCWVWVLHKHVSWYGLYYV